MSRHREFGVYEATNRNWWGDRRGWDEACRSEEAHVHLLKQRPGRLAVEAVIAVGTEPTDDLASIALMREPGLRCQAEQSIRGLDVVRNAWDTIRRADRSFEQDRGHHTPFSDGPNGQPWRDGPPIRRNRSHRDIASIDATVIRIRTIT